MANLQNKFNDESLNQLQNTKHNMKVDSRYNQREPHNIQEGIRKDKKIKMNRKLNG